MTTDKKKFSIGAVVIGRNEGQRLVTCLNALVNQVDYIVYVDSGSTDNSLQEAKNRRVDCISLDLNQPFTAARARNGGAKYLIEKYPDIKFIQFIDGDCELQVGWIETAGQFLDTKGDYAIACGRRRERFPKQSVYNQLCDIEWNTPVGDTKSCGGDALVRVSAFTQVDGYNDSLIAGEEPEMCFRLREKGWKIFRLDAEMALHDAAMTRLDQWWNRTKRSGYAYACSYALHGRGKEKFKQKEMRSILLWAGIIPIMIITLGFVKPILLLLLLIYPVQVVRIALKQGRRKDKKIALSYGFYTVLAKFPQLFGVLRFVKTKLTGQKTRLIEYK